MTTIYLIRHSKKDKNYNKYDHKKSFQTNNEKIVLSAEGEQKALSLSKHTEMKNIDAVWLSNYTRAIQTAQYICEANNVELNISSDFDERHYGSIDEFVNKEEFWINQFTDKFLKTSDGESQFDVQNRMDKKIREILQFNEGKKIAIVCHNACILFYLLKYCNLDSARINKKLTISYKNKILINDNIMESPSIMKLEFEGQDIKNIEYIF